MKNSEFNLTNDEKKFLLKLARKTIEEYLTKQSLSTIDKNEITENLKTNCGAFVTLHLNHNLRGCIGTFSQDTPLYNVIQRMAIASATEDYRFNPVTAQELPYIDIEISVLTPLKRIHDPSEIILGKHGIYIKKGYRSGTFLPQVAQETGWTLEEFLGHCARDKAGLSWDGWKDAELYTYEAIVFSEKDFQE